jgi:hypothetical protein
MSVTDLRLLDPSRTDRLAALQAAAKAANFRRRTGRRTLTAEDCEGLVSLVAARSQEAAEGDGGLDARRRGEAVQAAGGGLELRAGHVDTPRTAPERWSGPPTAPVWLLAAGTKSWRREVRKATEQVELARLFSRLQVPARHA